MSSDPYALKRWCAAGVMAMTCASQAVAQSIVLERDDLSFGQVEAGPVELDLEVVVNTVFDLDSVTWALVVNDPSRFAYRDPVLTIGSPFVEGNLSQSLLPAPGQTLDQLGVFQFFSVAETFGPERFPATVATIHLESVEALAPGMYTIAFDTTRTEWGDDFVLNPFLNTVPFTLTVTETDEGDDGDGDDGDDGNGGDTPDGNGGGGSNDGPAASGLCAPAAGQAMVMSLLMLGVVGKRTARRAAAPGCGHRSVARQIQRRGKR